MEAKRLLGKRDGKGRKNLFLFLLSMVEGFFKTKGWKQKKKRWHRVSPTFGQMPCPTFPDHTPSNKLFAHFLKAVGPDFFSLISFPTMKRKYEKEIILSPEFKLEPFRDDFLLHKVQVIRNILVVLGSNLNQFFLIFKDLLTYSFKKVLLTQVGLRPDISFCPSKDCVIVSSGLFGGYICGYTLEGVILFYPTLPFTFRRGLPLRHGIPLLFRK